NLLKINGFDLVEPRRDIDLLWLTNGNARLQTFHNSCRYLTASSERGIDFHTLKVMLLGDPGYVLAG
ncbi:hypothetical protein QUG97_27835, partial [Klebsiella michiganensis]|uniref:hypothetical protein n=1 Tax=Klebsiella michiganensis TaxID=1134687 RepID=UPI0025A1E8F5